MALLLKYVTNNNADLFKQISVFSLFPINLRLWFADNLVTMDIMPIMDWLNACHAKVHAKHVKIRTIFV